MASQAIELPCRVAKAFAPPTDLVAAFFAGRNPRTLEAYRQDLADFRVFLGAEDVAEAVEILLARGNGAANSLALAYRSHLVERGLQAATVNRRLAAVRSLVKLARTVGLVSWALDVGNLRSENYRDTRGPGRQGFRRLLDELEARTDPKGVRDRCMLRFLYDLALRRAEVCSLDLEHVDLEAGRIAIMGKGRSQREWLSLPVATSAVLAAWVAVRGDGPGPLFVNFDRAGKGNRLTGTGLYLLVRSLGEKAGIKVRPHGLRHAGITAALDLTNGNLRTVQRFSRHRDVRVLSRYDDNRADLGGDVAKLVAADAL